MTDSILADILIGIGLYALGFISGYAFRAKMHLNLRVFITVITVTGFFISLLAEIFNPFVYSVHPMMYGLMGMIVGYFYKEEFKGIIR